MIEIYLCLCSTFLSILKRKQIIWQKINPILYIGILFYFFKAFEFDGLTVGSNKFVRKLLHFYRIGINNFYFIIKFTNTDTSVDI